MVPSTFSLQGFQILGSGSLKFSPDPDLIGFLWDFIGPFLVIGSEYD